MKWTCLFQDSNEVSDTATEHWKLKYEGANINDAIDVTLF